ncbi:MAG: hypothetical protein J5903_04470, partial [Clostridia bacterium]|nr:hypothetical protein [Clostridia bacterium]
VRESEEMTEALKRVVGKKPGIINIAESITVIVLSVGMIITPSFHHAHLHIIILGIELILEIVFASLEYLYDNRHEKSAVKDAVEKTLSQNNEDESRSA